MRIAMVGPFGFSPKKTMRARAFRLARELVKRGHTVAMFMPPWHTPEQADKIWVEDGVHIRYVALDGNPLAISRRLFQEIMTWQPDVVHAFKPKAYSGVVAEWLWRTQRKNLRIIMDTDDWEGWGGWNDKEPYPYALKHVFAQQEKWGMRHCHVLTVASKALETLALGQGVRQNQIVYIPNGSGIDSAESPPPQPSAEKIPTFLLYTRFFEFDVARLVSVFKRLQQSIPKFKILVVGASLQAQDGAQFFKLLAQAGLGDFVEDVGWVDEKKLPAVLRSADIALYPMDDNLLNRTKCPVKLADVAALGLPVVAEAVGQVTEYVVHGQTGLVVATGDVAGMADALGVLWNSAEMRDGFGRAAQQHIATHFNWAEQARRLEQSYYP